MDYIQFFTILATIVGGLGSIIGLFAWFHYDIKLTIKEIREDVRIQGSRIDQQYAIFSEKLDQQSARTDQLYSDFQEGLRKQTERSDQLYTMFIDLLKSKK